MQEKPPEKTGVSVKKLEHLKEGISPIMACVGTAEDFMYDGKINWLRVEKEINYAHNVDFDEKSSVAYKKEGFKNDGMGSYVISPLDGIDKYSRDYYDCTGVILAGKEKKTGKNVSVMSHQNPAYFLEKDSQRFADDLVNRLDEIKEKCEEKTIDVVIFGGIYAKVRNFKEQDPNSDMYVQIYLKSIKFLSEIIQNSLGFEPIVIMGPKTNAPGSDLAFFDNDAKKLFLMRDGSGLGVPESYMPNELEEISKTWKRGEWGLPI